MGSGFTHTIPKVTQVSDALCWRYCAEVLYLFKHGMDKSKEFGSKLGKFAKVATMLTVTQTNECYEGLGFRRWKVEDLSVARIRLQPVIIGYSRNLSVDGHLVLIVGEVTKGTVQYVALDDGCLSKSKNVCKSGRETLSIKKLNQSVYKEF